MPNIVTIGRKLIPAEHIALVEPFDPTANPEFKTERAFRARIALINRDSILTEDTPEIFAEAQAFRMVADDRVATNPAITFRVETFTPTEGFKPAKSYVTRIVWRDHDGNEQSKLLLSKPETVIAIALRGEAAPHPDREAPRRPTPARTSRRRASACAEQA